MLKQFFSLLKRYILPYRKYLTWALILNFLSQWLNVFSFMAIVPILNILFKIDTKSYEYIPMDIHNLDKDVLINNAYYFVSNFVATNGAFYTLAMMGGILIFMTMLKTAGYFASAAVMVPLRTGIVRDIRIQVYNKVLSLPLSFFSEERKGDIIARMSADVTVVENSLTSSIDMLIRNPIALLVCFVTLFSVSWQMTLFEQFCGYKWCVLYTCHDGRNTYLYDYVENCRLFCFCGCHGTFAYRYCPGYPYSGL